MWHQVIVVEKSYPEHCGVDTHTQEEDTDEAHHLVEGNKTEREGRLDHLKQCWMDYIMLPRNKSKLWIFLQALNL